MSKNRLKRETGGNREISQESIAINAGKRDGGLHSPTHPCDSFLTHNTGEAMLTVWGRQ